MRMVPQFREELEIKLRTNRYNASGLPTKPGRLLYMFIEKTAIDGTPSLIPAFFKTLTLGFSTLYIMTYAPAKLKYCPVPSVSCDLKQ